MKHDDGVYLHHILDAIARIEEYTTAENIHTFHSKHLVQDGVIRQLEIIGEAVKQLTHDFRDKYPDIAWQDIAGMRDKLIHHYFGVDLDAVWLTVQEDLPNLRNKIKKALDRMKTHSQN